MIDNPTSCDKIMYSTLVCFHPKTQIVLYQALNYSQIYNFTFDQYYKFKIIIMLKRENAVKGTKDSVDYHKILHPINFEKSLKKNEILKNNEICWVMFLYF